MLVQVFEPVVRLAEEGGQGLEAADRPALADLEQDRLRPVDGDFCVVRFLVPDRRDLARRPDQVTEHRLALDDAPVVLDVDGCRHHVHDRGQVRWASDSVERLALGVQREHGSVDIRVLLAVEVLRMEEVRDPQDGVPVDEQRPENTLFSVYRLWRELVDAHLDRGASAARGGKWVLRLHGRRLTQRTLPRFRPRHGELSTR